MALISDHLVERLETERDELRERVTALEAQLAEVRQRVESMAEWLGLLEYRRDDD